jgi:DNA-binding beta-propeller fold protein YncE
VQPAAADTLSSGTTSGDLAQGAKLVSKNGKYVAIMQTDGNFVIYAANAAIWASNTVGKGSAPFKLSMQADGNLVIYANGRAIWASNTRGTTTPFKLIMQDDGNLCIYDGASHFVWETRTAR